MIDRADPELAGLYIHLYFDEDVALTIVENIISRRFDATCARDEKMLNKDDPEHLLYAISLRRAIVTHNRIDFEREHQRYLEAGLKHYGIIIAKRRVKKEEVVARLLILLNSITAEEMRDPLRYI